MDDEEIKKRRLLYEVEDELWRLIKRRAWIVVVFLALVGVGGLWAAVHVTVRQVADGPLKDLQRQLIQAELQAESARKANAEATTAANQARADLTSLQGTIQALRNEAKSVEDKFGLVSQQIDAAAKNAALRSQRDFNAVQERISALETLVKRIGDENAATRQAAAEYAKQIAALENKFDREQKRFAENSAYSISIFAVSEKRVLAQEIQRRLASVGFRVTLSELPLKVDKTTLTYHEKNEAKAKEILSMLGTSLKDVQLIGISSKKPLAEAPKLSTLDLFKSDGWSSLSGLNIMQLFDPNSFSLSIGR